MIDAYKVKCVDAKGAVLYYQSKSKTKSRFVIVEVGILVYVVERRGTWSGEWRVKRIRMTEKKMKGQEYKWNKEESKEKRIELDFYTSVVSAVHVSGGDRGRPIAYLLLFLLTASPEFLFTTDVKEFCRQFFNFVNIFSDVQLPRILCMIAASRIAHAAMGANKRDDMWNGSHPAIDTMTSGHFPRTTTAYLDLASLHPYMLCFLPFTLSNGMTQKKNMFAYIKRPFILVISNCPNLVILTLNADDLSFVWSCRYIYFFYSFYCFFIIISGEEQGKVERIDWKWLWTKKKSIWRHWKNKANVNRSNKSRVKSNWRKENSNKLRKTCGCGGFLDLHAEDKVLGIRVAQDIGMDHLEARVH